MDVEKRLMTVSEAAAALSLSRSQVYVLVANGTVRSIKIGKSRRIPIGALDEFIASIADQSPITTLK